MANRPLEVGKVYLRHGKPVFITEGQYLGRHGVSNHWYWKPIETDGSLGKEESGYDNEGAFSDYLGKYEIKIILEG